MKITKPLGGLDLFGHTQTRVAPVAPPKKPPKKVPMGKVGGWILARLGR